MGLAASQARFLAITARKADCEFRSMQNAQEKLSVTRELAQASADYQEAMNQTKLVMDFDGQGALMQGLNYGLLMTPTEMNGYNPYLVTQRTGEIVLNSKMYNAAIAAGLDPKGNSERSARKFKEFMYALCEQGVVATSVRDEAYKLSRSTYLYTSGNTTVPRYNPTEDEISRLNLKLADKGLYDKNIGNGATPLCKEDENLNTKKGLLYQLNKIEKAYADDDDVNTKTLEEILKSVVSGSVYSGGSGISINGRFTDKMPTINDLFNSDVVYVTKSDNINSNIDVIFNNIEEKLKKLLGTDILSNDALNKAKWYVKNAFLKNEAVDTGRSNGIPSSISQTAPKYNSPVTGTLTIKRSDDVQMTGVSLSNLVAAYLTYFDNMLNGFDSGYFVGQSRENSIYVTDNPDYLYVMNKGDSVGNDVKRTDFYMQLFNNICIHGFCEDSGIDAVDSKLDQKLKNGTYFLSTLSVDGYFYQDRYNETDYIVEVKDEDAIARAEAEFAAMKTKLTYKEEKLDIEMKNIDLELSSLTTEYDSVKQIISNNVQKVFTQFQ